jgi:uncharacterized protein (DUF1800 family)
MDRRQFLKQFSGSASSAAQVSPSTIFAGGPRVLSTSLSPWTPEPGDWNALTAAHLYRRAGFSATMSEINAALQMRPAELVDQLLDDKWVLDANMPTLPDHASDWMHQPFNGGDTQQQIDFRNAIMAIRRNWAVAMVKPGSMLRERLSYFWLNHFVIEAIKVQFPTMVFHYLDYFRHNPWGNFKQMVKDVTISPAMLYYLDGWTSRRTRPNENYARELMELFTLGVTDKNGDPNYSEDDIHEVAKALTGYTIDFTSTAPDVMLAKYQITAHDNSLKTPFADAGAPKAAYGLASGGQTGVVDIIDTLFSFKADKVAYFICSKIYQFFVYHEIGDTEKSIIGEMADLLQSSNWEIKPVISQLLKSEHFFDAGNIGAQIKSPYDYAIGLARVFDIPLDELGAGTLWYYSNAMEQSLLDPPNVKGWPGYHNWLSTTTLPYRNTYMATPFATQGKIRAIGNDGYGNPYTQISWTDDQVLIWAKQFVGWTDDLEAFILSASQFLCGVVPSESLRKAAVQDPLNVPTYEWAGLSDTVRISKLRQIVSAILVLPEFQLL